MPFKMHCPKCNTYNYSIERDRYAYSQKRDAAGLVFSCRCGKRMFGKMLIEEYDLQKANHGDSPATASKKTGPMSDRQAAEVEKKKALQEAFLYRAKYVQKKKQEEEAEALTEKERRDAAWKSRIAEQEHALIAAGKDPSEATAPNNKTKETQVVAAEGEPTCQWPGCPNAARKRSKYCSRSCSNKNARQRYKARKKSDASAT